MCSLCYSGKGCKKRCWVRDFACFCLCKSVGFVITNNNAPLAPLVCPILLVGLHTSRAFVQHYPIPLCKLFIFYPPRFRHFSMNKLWTVIRLSTACCRKFWTYDTEFIGEFRWCFYDHYARTKSAITVCRWQWLKIWGIIFIRLTCKCSEK